MKTENDNLEIELIEIHLLKQKKPERNICHLFLFLFHKYNAVV